MECKDYVGYKAIDFAQETRAQIRHTTVQPQPNTYYGPRFRNHPIDSDRLNSRSPRDALPPLPPKCSIAMRSQSSLKQSVPGTAAVVRSQTFTPHHTPPMIPKRRGRHSSYEVSLVPTSPRPRLPGMTPPTHPATQRKQATSSPIHRALSVDSDIPDRVTSALVDPIDKDRPISLAHFVKQYSNSLPLRIRVDKGFCGQNEQEGISSGDVYTIHFLKRTKMVTIADTSGYTYRIPLNSAVEFALLYDPDQNFRKASRGYNFERAGNIIALKTKLPNVVRALRAHNTNDPKSSVDEKELFVVKGMKKTTFTRKSTLKVYSVTNQKEKVLTEDCMGKFTTASSYVSMYVAEILEYVPDQLPLKVAVCTDSDDILPAGLTTDAATIQNMDIKTSLIATPCLEEDEDDDHHIPVEISINLDIDVTILEDDDEMDYDDTRKLLEDFDLSKVRLCHSKPGEDLYCAVREGHESLGTEIERPQILSTMQQASVTPQGMDKIFRPAFRTGHGKEDCRLLSLGSESNSGSTASAKTGIYSYIGISASESLENCHHSGRSSIIKHQDRLSTNVTEKEQNIAFLQTLNKWQILNLLDAMKLSQYKAIFEQEQVDGTILAECNEAMLESDLNIVKKLHRVRIMQIIRGIHSVESILEEANPGWT